ncbi:reverse transcriptase domain-containing protein [Tanacetum coccineum]
MSINEQTPLSQPTSVVRNTLGKEPVLQDPGRPISDEALREYCDRNYHQILPIIAKNVQQEKAQQEKLKAVKARLNFEETSHHSQSGTPIRRRGPKERLGRRYVRSRSGSPEPRRGRSERRSYHSSQRDTKSCHQSSRSRITEPASERRYNKRASSRRTDELSQSEGSAGDPFTPWIRYFDFPKTRMPSHIKTYDGSEYPEDHLNIFQSAAKTERWAMPTWCHMFNSTLTRNARVWFDDLPKETIDSYDDLKKAFLENYLQEKKCIKDPVKIHNIRIANPDLIKRLHDKIPKSVDEMMRVTTAFLRGEVAASNREQKKSFPSWKQQEANQKQNFKKGGFRNQQRSERKQDRFALLTKTPKEIFALDKGKFKAPPPMTTPVEKKDANKFCEFHEEVEHNTDEWEDEGTKGPMIIEAEIGGHCVHRMYIDDGSASEILYEHCFSRLRLKIKKQLIPATTPLIGFSGEIICPIGQIQLLVTIGDEEHSASALMNFLVVRSPSPYNGIIGRPGVRKLQAFPSTVHGMLKIPVEGGVITLKSSRLVPLECEMVSGPERTVLANESTSEQSHHGVVQLSITRLMQRE